MAETVYYGVYGKETIVSQSDVEACEERRKSVEKTLEEMEEGIDRFEYWGK